MATLTASLQGASSAILAFGQALGAEQSNVSNINTPGYAAVRAIIGPVGLGSGATDTVILQSTGSSGADAVVQAATSQASDSQTAASYLNPVNQQFDITGSTGILAAFQQFSTAFANLSVTPNDASLRTAAISAARSVALAFTSIAGSLDSQKQSLDASVQSTVAQINSLTSQIARYNVSIKGQTELDPGADASRRAALDQLSSLTGITVNQNEDGTLNVLAGGSVPLVLGDHAFRLSANPSATPGSQIASDGGGVSPPSFSGKLGGLLDTRNNVITPILGDATTAGSLNTLAQGFAGRVNALLLSGTTSSGAPGVPIFTYDNASASNVARTLAVDPSVTQDQLAVAATVPSAQSNGIANQLAALASSSNAFDQIAGQSSQDYYAAIAAGVGGQLSAATQQEASDQTSLTSVEAIRTSVSGVSLDSEAVNITALERSWEAAAKVVSVLDNLILNAVNLVGTPVS